VKLRLHGATPTPQRLFFFSSRRRHTRSTRDWSSDVCSSDLSGGAHTYLDADPHMYAPPEAVVIARGRQPTLENLNNAVSRRIERSEERRVGKEGRARGAAAA